MDAIAPVAVARVYKGCWRKRCSTSDRTRQTTLAAQDQPVYEFSWDLSVPGPDNAVSQSEAGTTIVRFPTISGEPVM